MTGAASATTGATVVRGALWNTAARVAPQSYTLILSVVAARFLGPDGMGRQSFIAFVALSVTSLLSGGLSAALTRYVGDTLGAGRLDTVRGLVRWAWGVATVLGIVGGMAVATVGLAGGSPETAWILAGAVCAVAILHTIPNGTLAGAQSWRRSSVAGLITGSLSVPAVIVVLALDGGIVGMFAVELVAVILNLAWTAWLARRLLRDLTPRSAPAGELAARTGRLALITTGSSVVTLVVWTRSEFFFLDHYSTDAQIALYSIAFAAQAALVIAITAGTAVTVPAFATLVGAGHEKRMHAGYARATRLTVLAALPLAAAAFSLGPDLIELVYGREYAGTRPVVRILLLALPFVPLAALSSSLLFAQGKVKVIFVLGATAAVINLGLDAWLIPTHDAVGAAIANTGAQLVMAVGFVFVQRSIGSSGWPRLGVVRVAVVAVGMGAAGVAVVSALDGGILGVAAGAVSELVVFAALARVVGFVPPGDAAWLQGIVGPRLGTVAERALRLAGRPA